MVVLYHIGWSVIGGGYVGVDVFFVISGFLITSQLYREIENSGTISILGFYSRRIARLLPAAILVAIVSTVAAWFWLPQTRFRSIALDWMSASLYFINYRLAAQGTQYLGASAPPSPLQNFWSLAVEEQFYFIWPAVMLLSALAWRVGKRGGPSRRKVMTVLAVMTISSFGLGVWQTGENAPWAFFGVPFRAWELAIGAMVAVGTPMLSRMPRLVAAVTAVVGLATVIACGALYTDGIAFPGYAALPPVLGTAAVIAAGCGHERTLPTSWLLARPVCQGIGRVSYSWYLWHWPVLTIMPVALGVSPNLGFNLLLAVWSLALAGVTYALIENPVRFDWARRVRPAITVRIGLSCSVVVAVAAMCAMHLPIRTLPVGDVVVGFNPAIGSVGPETELSRTLESSATLATVPVNLTPGLNDVSRDYPRLYQDKCDPDLTSSTVRECVYGDTAATETVVLFGDSHAGQWFPAMDAIARERHWRLIPFTKDACTAASVMINLRELKRNYVECVQWRTNVLERLANLHPTRVVLSSNGDGGRPVGAKDVDRAWRDGWVETIRAVKAVTREIILIEDTPWPLGRAPDCVAEHPENVSLCARPISQAIAKPRRKEMVRKAAEREGVKIIDPVFWFCTQRTCPVIVGNVLVYRDSSHVTATYSQALAPVLSGRLP
jgi:peptidoglycan/LPS O-acetylase OafA/YrhL